MMMVMMMMMMMLLMLMMMMMMMIIIIMLTIKILFTINSLEKKEKNKLFIQNAIYNSFRFKKHSI